MTKPKTKENAPPVAPRPSGFFEDTGAAFSAVLGFNPGAEDDGVDEGSSEASGGGGNGEGGGGKPAAPVAATVEIKHLFEPLARSAVPTTAPGQEGESDGGEDDSGEPEK